MKYSLKEALRELRNPKKSLKESTNDDVNNLSPEEVVTKYIFEPMGIEEEDSEYLEQTDDDGYKYENIVHYLSEEDWQKLFDEFSDIEGDKKLRTLLPEKIGDYELEPYWELDRGTYRLNRPAVAFYTYYIGESDEEDEEDIDESLNEDVNTEKDNFEAAVEFYQTNPNNLNSRQLANNIGKHSKYNLPDHLVSAILNGVTDYAEATEFDGNDAIAELRDNIESLNGKSLVEVLSFFDDIEFAENWNTFNIVDSNNNVIFDESADLGENDWYASIADLCYDGPLTKYSNDTVKDIIIDSKHSDNMDARKVTIVMQNHLNEAKQGKVVTAATILKKSQNEIFAESTEEGMRKKVLSILEKNKDKMSPENYNTVVKTMTKCPKSAVPSTVWTMLNPNQKLGN